MRPVADDDQLDAGQVGQRGQIVHLFLGPQPPHVADNDLAIGGPAVVQLLVALVWVEAFGVDSPAPYRNSGEASVDEFVAGEAGRRQVDRRQVVHIAQVAPQQRFGRGVAVLGGILGNLGLVERDAGQSQPGRGGYAFPAEHHGGGQMHHIRAEVGQHPLDLQ